MLFSSISFTPFKKNSGVKIVVIDAGHGGKDPGCNGAVHNEKEVTLAIALKLGKLIEENLKDVKVIYTRKSDVFVELEERAQVANRNNADLFISIHCNAAAKFVTYKDKNGKTQYKTWKDKKGKIHKKEVTNPVPYGSETYVMGIKNEKGKMEVAKRENASMLLEENYEKTYNGFDPSSDEAYIIMSLTTSAYVEQSAKFASLIQNEYKNKAGRIDKGVQRQSIWVLWRTAMPSILTEVGFLTNPIEEKFLGSEKGQTYMASAIFRALRNYKNDVEGKNEKFNDDIENQEALENENLLYQKEHPELVIKSEEESKDTIGETLSPLKAPNAPIENKDIEKYNAAIKQADEKLKERKLDEAKSIYLQAIQLKKDETYPKQKLAEIAKLEAEIKKAEEDKTKANEAQNKQYNDLIAKADKLTADKKWEDAKKKYQEALIVKPGEKYPQQKIKEIDEKEKILKQQAIYEASGKKYDETIEEANKLLNAKKWEDAKKKYQEALKYKQHDEYCLKKIKEIEEKQAALSETQNDTAKIDPKDLINNYAGQNKKDTTKKISSIKGGIEFKVQFTSSDKEIETSSNKLKGLENVGYYKAGAVLKYTAGVFKKPDEAVKYQTKVRELGYKDAFVVAFKNGERIDYKEALKQVK